MFKYNKQNLDAITITKCNYNFQKIMSQQDLISGKEKVNTVEFKMNKPVKGYKN